ncbi:MAG: YraN family protein [Patescibacteria group bacterium]|nr:YraN family protein [Patescibacteria group bacterium]
MSKKSTGNKGEQLAAEYLEKKGFKILATNFFIQWGEIDIVAVKENKLHFIEVKTRTSVRKGRPEEAVNFKKLKRIWKAGIIFMGQNKIKQPFQIDVLAVLMDKQQNKIFIRYFPNISFDTHFNKR